LKFFEEEGGGASKTTDNVLDELVDKVIGEDMEEEQEGLVQGERARKDNEVEQEK
jgi:hypothetical protein